MRDQEFSSVSSGEPVAEKVAVLREQIAALGLDGFVVPHDDAYKNEYIPVSEGRLCFVSGFSGSAGVVVVLADSAALFVDGRYTLQAREQTDRDVFELCAYPKESEVDWALRHLSSGAKLGFDPWLHSSSWMKAAQMKAGARGVELVPVEMNPVDGVWADRPAIVRSDVFAHSEIYAGESSVSKRARIAADLRSEGLDAFVITDPASLAWLLNIRGADVMCTPLALGYAVLRAEDGSVDLFMDAARLSEDVLAHLGVSKGAGDAQAAVRVHAPDDFLSFLSRNVGQGDGCSGARFATSFAVTPVAIVEACQGRLVDLTDPCSLPKACKNKVELEGMHACHLRDGAALVRFLRWLSSQPVGSVDELGVIQKLYSFRASDPLFRGESFETIAGSGPNGAIIHYRADEGSNRVLGDGEFLVLDSGGQYLDGTTDVTRTIVCGNSGELTSEMKDRYTRVLKGYIALASAVFPAGTCGAQLDPLARQYLWQVGLDYPHGTGHGVGSFLSVHEGPARITRPTLLSAGLTVPLVEGMVFSNEPGYYKAGAYGIRHENLQAVVPVEVEGAECEMLGFDILTLCPFDVRALDSRLLTEAERDWLNAYHVCVIEGLSPLLDPEDVDWLWKFCGVV